MYYYSIKCVIYTPEESKISSDFFSANIPSFDLSHLKYLENYKHPTNEKQPFLKRRTSQPIKHVPPTPIHDDDQVTSHAHHGLEGKIDFRFGPIELTCITTRKKKPVTTQHALGYGVLYIYRDEESLSENETPDTKLAKDESLNIVNEQQDTVVCVVAVPSYLSRDDFLNFLGTYNTYIEQYRFIRDYAPNKYTVLLKFKDRQSTVAFYQKYNGRRFNMTEPEISHVVYLKKYEIKSELIPPNSYPYLNTTVQQKEPNMYELPLCPVCLERMDESITGLSNNNVCHHTQQCDCIHKWGKPSCPICLYSYKPTKGVIEAATVPTKPHCCFECQSMESLWICLICGNIGCGRYQEAHAYDHYRETNHLFALEIETQHIWDYVTDGYVHRLIQQVDGGFVELPETGKQVEESSGSKLDQISLDYSYMLTSQLDSQRIYYEEQLEHLVESVNGLNMKVKGLQQEVETSKQERDKLVQEGKALDANMLEVKKEKEKVDKRIASYKDKYQATQRNLNEEKLLTSSLLVNNKLLKKDYEKKEATIASLGEQVKELMSKLESTNQ